MSRLACTLLASAWLLAPASVAALAAGDVAGELNGDPVTVAEVDRILDGRVRRYWQEMGEIARAAARAICIERGLARRTAGSAQALEDLRVELWQRAVPDADALAAFLASAPAAPDGVGPRYGEHGLRVRRYRQLETELADQAIGDSFVLAPALASSGGADASALPDAEPVLPDPVGSCLGEPIAKDEVERYASFPLFRRRAEIVSSVCRQFEIDYSNPLLIERVASARGLGPEELWKSVEGEAGEAPPDEIAALARSRYGDESPVSLAKVRLAIEAKRRVDARMRFIEALRSESTGECGLSLPPPPVASLPRGPGAAGQAERGPLRVVYYGNFRCHHCPEGWQVAQRVRERWGASIDFELRHHFPDKLLDPFLDALAAECSDRQGRLDAYARWKLAHAREIEPPVDELGLEPERFAACRADPRTAVAVLGETAEALRLGFREAMPSWVIGERPRRGFQGDAVVNETVREQIASRSAAVARADVPANEGKETP